MNYEQVGLGLIWKGRFSLFCFSTGLCLLTLLVVVEPVRAGEVTLKAIDYSEVSGNRLQIQLVMSGPIEKPKVFQTDNPARIALDLVGVVNGLEKKRHPINIDAVASLYAITASGRLRVVINLLELVPYKMKVAENKVYITIEGGKNVQKDSRIKSSVKKQSDFSDLLPEQSIQRIDFRRGSKGEGRLLISLSNPNTIVDSKEQGGNVVLNLTNTKLPPALIKRMDVSDFATPVKFIDVKPVGSKVRILITPNKGHYDYSSFQSEGLLTVEFRPLTATENERLEKEKFLYTGERLSLNFQNIEVRSVLQILSDFTSLNIVAADTVGGTVTLRLNDVPWDQALDFILKSKGLAKRQTGNVMLVAPIGEITKIDRDEIEAIKVENQLDPLRTEYIQVNYAKAENFRNLLLGKSSGGSDGCSVVDGSSGSVGGGGSIGGADGDNLILLSARGTAIVDSRTNVLIVRDTSKQLEEIRKLIQLLDIPVRQVLIESRIVVAEDSFMRELGVKFGVAKANALESDKVFGLTATGVETSGLDADSILDDLGSALAASSGGSLALTLARGADYILNLEIRALQFNGKAELISNPRVMTSDRCQALIKQGVQIPYQTSSQDGPVTELVDAVLELDVTPQITPNGNVIMDLKIKKDNPGTALETGFSLAVPIENREVRTTVQVNDGETVVLGGIYEGEYREGVDSVPWFADLPVVGWLFRQTNTDRAKRELLIFVTPKIVKETLAVQ